MACMVRSKGATHQIRDGSTSDDPLVEVGHGWVRLEQRDEIDFALDAEIETRAAPAAPPRGRRDRPGSTPVPGPDPTPET